MNSILLILYKMFRNAIEKRESSDNIIRYYVNYLIDICTHLYALI